MDNVIGETRKFLREKNNIYNDIITDIALSCVDFKLTQRDLEKINKYREQVSIIYQINCLLDELEEKEVD